MQMDYLDHLPATHRLPAAHLYLEVLGDKLLPVLGSIEKARRIMVPNLAPDHCIAALGNRKLVGIIGIQTRERGFWNPALKSLTAAYGLPGGLYRLIGLSFLQHKTGPDEWHVDGIAVAPKMRGRGIGTELLGRLEQNAGARGIGKISLQVADTNQKARTLYQRLGFVATRRQCLWPFNRIYRFPFCASIRMEKTIA